MTFLWILGIIGVAVVAYFVGAACATFSEIDLEERVSALYWALRVLVEAVDQLGDGSTLESAMAHAKRVLREDNR